jgi:hypothetical protein
MNYDIIGDVHGCDLTLTSLLKKLSYSLVDGVYQHDMRKVIFLGDFVDHGPRQKEVIDIVRPMVEGGHALSVMGNHEFNAIAYATYNDDLNDYLRPHTLKNEKDHKTFLNAYENNKAEYDDVVAWFKTLPLWLDLGEFRIIHACWDKEVISKLGDSTLTDDLLIKSSTKNTWEYDAIEILLKGKELPLGENKYFKDSNGNNRHHIRVRWWDKSATTYKAAFIGPESALTQIPDDETFGDHLVDYSHNEPPLFLGHYWFNGKPSFLASNIACVDYSVAKPGGKLAAYRWNQDEPLSDDNFIVVERIEK